MSWLCFRRTLKRLQPSQSNYFHCANRDHYVARVRAACKAFTIGGSVLVNSTGLLNSHFFPTFPFLQETEGNQSRHYHLFPPPTKFFHPIKCYAYALPAPNIHNSFEEPRKGQFLYLYLYLVSYGSGISSIFPCNCVILHDMTSLHHYDILSQLFGRIVDISVTECLHFLLISILSK